MTGNSYSVISHFKFSADISDTDFSDDENYFIIATESGRIE